jgi:salicylate hydroxylase
MMQYFAQGACMAMEDAVCLAHMVDAHQGDVEAALDHYRRRRVLRTARVQLQSRWIGEHIYHPSGPHARLRNTMLRAKSQDEMYDTVAWLYGGSGLTKDPAIAAGALGTAKAPMA